MRQAIEEASEAAQQVAAEREDADVDADEAQHDSALGVLYTSLLLSGWEELDADLRRLVLEHADRMVRLPRYTRHKVTKKPSRIK
jgi:hypothetical protein